jgi:hypothetical protein
VRGKARSGQVIVTEPPIFRQTVEKFLDWSRNQSKSGLNANGARWHD